MAMVMWMVAAYQQTHSPRRLAWSEGWWPPGAGSAVTSHDDSTIDIVLVLLLKY